MALLIRPREHAGHLLVGYLLVSQGRHFGRSTVYPIAAVAAQSTEAASLLKILHLTVVATITPCLSTMTLVWKMGR